MQDPKLMANCNRTHFSIWFLCQNVNILVWTVSQIYDAGEVFGIMQYQDEEVEEEEETKKDNPGQSVLHKVMVTRDSGLSASEPTR